MVIYTTSSCKSPSKLDKLANKSFTWPQQEITWDMYPADKSNAVISPLHILIIKSSSLDYLMCRLYDKYDIPYMPADMCFAIFSVLIWLIIFSMVFFFLFFLLLGMGWRWGPTVGRIHPIFWKPLSIKGIIHPRKYQGPLPSLVSGREALNY